LFISGFSNPVVAEPECDDFVQKPFRPAELLGCVWELLQRGPPHGPRRLPAWTGRTIMAAK
jgi:DNA-binding response OmpR family regulator